MLISLFCLILFINFFINVNVLPPTKDQNAPLDDIFNYFRKVNNPPPEHDETVSVETEVQNYHYNEAINTPITDKEITKAVIALQYNKLTDSDHI